MKALSFACAAMVSVALFAEVLEVNVGSGTQDGYTSEQLTAIGGGTVTEIQKTGDGTLISKGIASFTGTIRVSAGLLQLNASDKTGLGTTNGPTIVESGAAIRISNGACGSENEEFRISGTGISGGGAIVGAAWTPLGKLVLLDDAKVVMGNRAEFKSVVGGFIDLDGNTLTITGETTNDEYHFAVAEVRSVGTIVADNFKFLSVESDVPKKNGAKGRFVLRGTTAIMCYAAAATNRNIEWDLEWEAGGSGSSYVTIGPFNWSGDWILNRDTAFDPTTPVAVNLYGNLRGSGSLSKGNQLVSEIRLHGDDNDFTGNLEIRGGRVVVVKKAGLFANWFTRVQFKNLDTAMFAVGAKTASNPDGFDSADIQDFFDAMHDRTDGVFGVAGIYVPAGETFVTPLTFDAADTLSIYGRGSDKFKFGSCGEGTCVLTGPFIGSPKLTVLTYGDLRFSNPASDPTRVNTIGLSCVKLGKVTFADMGTLQLGGKFHVEGPDDTWTPHVSFTNTVVVNSTMCLPQDGNGLNGKISFLTDSVSSNIFTIATDGTSNSGTVAARGGDVVVTGSDTLFIGNIGQGCLLVESGRMTLAKTPYLGWRQNGIGQIFVQGGTLDASGKTISQGFGGTSVVYQAGGTINLGSGGFEIGKGESAFINSGLAHGQVSLAGGEAKMTGFANLGDGTKMTAFLNLVGGTLEAKGVKGAADKEDSYRDVAFDGGTLKAISTTSSLISGTLTATVYGGGAVIDTAGYNVSLGHALVAATGKGVAAITITNTLKSYVSPPVVCITGDGRGATAVPIFDFASGEVTGIRVTSPGYGYTTATATMRHGGSARAPANKAINLKVDLADNAAPVKLTKRGAGTLTVAAGELPADAVLSVEQGSLAGEGVTFSVFAVDVAKAIEGHGVIPAWPTGAKLDVSGFAALGERSKVTLLEITTPPATVPELAEGVELPDLWHVAVRDGKLVLYRERGLQFFVR